MDSHDFGILGPLLFVCFAVFAWFMHIEVFHKEEVVFDCNRFALRGVLVRKIVKSIIFSANIAFTVIVRTFQALILFPATIAALLVTAVFISQLLLGQNPVDDAIGKLYSWALHSIKQAPDGMVIANVCKDKHDHPTRIQPVCKVWGEQAIPLGELANQAKQNLLLTYAIMVVMSLGWTLLRYPGINYSGLSKKEHGADFRVKITNPDKDSNWTEWQGGDCPVPLDSLVYVRVACGEQSAGAVEANKLQWAHGVSDNDYDIVAYQVASGLRK